MNYFGSKPVEKYFRVFYFSANLNDPVAAGWGRKPSFYKARSYAKQHGLACLCLEDGFIRSLGLGKDGFQPLSIVVDRSGIYFDVNKTSDLEQLILNYEDIEENSRAIRAIKYITDNKITKYNHKIHKLSDSLLRYLNYSNNILLVDQTFGDQSIKFAGASALTFKKMLEQAHSNHPNSIIWIKTHPDVLAGKSQGHFSIEDFKKPYVKVITDRVNPIDLLSHFSEVYVVSSQMGFEALLLGKKVKCFGMPWYAGWGVTDDTYAPSELASSRRKVERSLEHLFACAYFQYARYVSPITGQVCDLEEILKLFIPNMKFQQNLPNNLVAYGFSPWKKKFIREYLNFPNIQLKFQKYLKPKKTDYVVAWGKKAYLLKQLGYTKVITVEDGFIRSVGLGANLIRPCSLVFDDVGIYYDATTPSRIEQLFDSVKALTEAQSLRVEGIISEIRHLEISKYNVGLQEKLERPVKNKKIILVVGQVEDDMSVQLGGVDIKTNLSLLSKVRFNNPDAYIIYKPHPDVASGLRVGAVSISQACKYADQIEQKVSIHRLFEIIDEIHTISSLSGFEALLKGLKVYCYGLPFYAGWGLTVDQHKCQRRNNLLSLQQMVYVTLIEYPSYNLVHTAKMDIPLVNIEDVIDFISDQKFHPPCKSGSLRNFFAKILKVVSFWKN